MAKKKSSSKPVKKTTKTQKAIAPGRNWLLEANEIIEKHFRKAVLFVFTLSLGLSLIYFLQANNTPIMAYHKWDNSDMHFFDTWAKHITAGDWWGDEVLHPFHNWHADFAVEYFKQFPEVAARYDYVTTDSLQSVTAQKAFINDIYKGKTFHQEPLYTYMLAITYSVFGSDVKWIYFWQFLLAAFTSVLVFLTGRQLFGSLAGLIAALFVTLCGSIMVYEMTLLRTTLTNFFTVLLLYLFLKVFEKPDLKRTIIFGAASGFALLGQSYFILFLFPAWIWLVWEHRKKWKEIAPVALAYIGALLVVMSPLFIRNIKEGLSVGAMASHGAMAYIPMNVQNSGPMESFYVHMPTYVRIRHDGEGKMIPTVIASLRTFDSFKSFWSIYKKKIDGLFMWREIPNNMNYYLYREIAPILKMMPVRYFFIAPLGMTCLILGFWRYRRRFIPFLLMTAACIIPLMIAGNFARYRTPLEIMMSLAAAYFIVEILTLLYQKRWKPLFIGLGITLAAFIYTSTIVPKTTFLWQGWDFDIFYRHFYRDNLLKYEAEGKHEEYLKLTTHMADKIPDYFMTVPLTKKIVRSNEAEASRHVANMLQSHKNILAFLNKKQEAAFFEDRIRILKARIDDFNVRAGIK